MLKSLGLLGRRFLRWLGLPNLFQVSAVVAAIASSFWEGVVVSHLPFLRLSGEKLFKFFFHMWPLLSSRLDQGLSCIDL